FYQEKLISLTKKGKAGAEEIKQMMAALRADPPQSLGGVKVKEIRDYATGVAHILADEKSTAIDLPNSDVLQFTTVDGDAISARPSATETKIQFYCSVKEGLASSDRYQRVLAKLEDKVINIMADIAKDS